MKSSGNGNSQLDLGRGGWLLKAARRHTATQGQDKLGPLR